MTPAVLVTRPATASDSLPLVLGRLGLRVLVVPAVATEPVEPGTPLDAAAARLAAYDWVVVTSASAVAPLVAAAGRSPGATPLPADPPRWAAVGPATASALEDAGVPVAAVAAGRAATIPAALSAVAPLDGVRILLPRADIADADLPASLRAAGAEVDDVVAYRTIEGPESSLEPLARALDDPDLAAVAVASGSAVRGLDRLAVQLGQAERVRALPFASIGPSTSAVVHRLGLRLAVEAAAPTPESLAEAVASILSLAPGLAAAPEPSR